MINQNKLDEYTEKYLKFRRAYAWLEKQTAEMIKKVADPLDVFWEEELTQEERKQWISENRKLIDEKGG